MSAVVLLLQETQVDVTQGPAEVTASVTNSATVPARIVLGAFPPLGGSAGQPQANAVAWTTVDEPLREIAAGATEQYKISIAPPAGTAAGRFPVRFIAYSADGAPEENADQARQLDAVIAAPVAPVVVAKKPRWWIYAVAAALVIVVGVVAFQVFPRPTPVTQATTTPSSSPPPSPPPSSAAPLGSVEAFSLPDFQTESGGVPGRTQKMPIGRYDYIENQLAEVGTDSITSLRIPVGLAVRAYEHSWFQGEWVDFRVNTPDVQASWRNRISSLIVYKASEDPPKIDYAVGFDSAWKSWMILRAGDYPDLSKTPLGSNTLSALLVPKGITVTVYDRPNFQGRRIPITFDVSDLNQINEWGDQASSLKVVVK
jgi:hypothetical protein